MPNSQPPRLHSTYWSGSFHQPLPAPARPPICLVLTVLNANRRRETSLEPL